MKVTCEPSTLDELYVRAWETQRPQTVVYNLRRHLAAAKLLWPEELRDAELTAPNLKPLVSTKVQD